MSMFRLLKKLLHAFSSNAACVVTVKLQWLLFVQLVVIGWGEGGSKAAAVYTGKEGGPYMSPADYGATRTYSFPWQPYRGYSEDGLSQVSAAYNEAPIPIPIEEQVDSSVSVQRRKNVGEEKKTLPDKVHKVYGIKSVVWGAIFMLMATVMLLRSPPLSDDADAADAAPTAGDKNKGEKRKMDPREQSFVVFGASVAYLLSGLVNIFISRQAHRQGRLHEKSASLLFKALVALILLVFLVVVKPIPGDIRLTEAFFSGTLFVVLFYFLAALSLRFEKYVNLFLKRNSTNFPAPATKPSAQSSSGDATHAEEVWQQRAAPAGYA